MAEETNTEPGLPRRPVDRIVKPLVRFLHIEAASGVILIACTVIALVAANSPLADSYLGLWKTEIVLAWGEFHFEHSLKHLINDGLMAVFFFVIGLEVKREIVLGELRGLRQAALPIAAAAGGMVVPAALYLAIQQGQPAARGWGIPMATDIAFVVGCMAVLGSRVPRGLRMMLLSLAIVDDIGAILVIAIGYTGDLSWRWLAAAAVGIALVNVLARIGVRRIPVYVVAGVLVWFACHESGVHATIAGVILGLMTPARPILTEGVFAEFVHRLGELFEGVGWETHTRRAETVRRFQRLSQETISPLEYLENMLHPWTGFVIMPLFALANAGVPLKIADLGDSIALAIIVGLVIGKPLGILSFSWLAVKLGWGRLPTGVTWSSLSAGACLAGIGFTMALFIAGLALSDGPLDTAKVGVLAGSAVSATLGLVLLIRTLPAETE